MSPTLIATAPASGSSWLRRVATLLYRKPNLYLLLLLVPPLLWFGTIYLASLLALLWQGFYTFDDFTMTVQSDLTLANFAALLQPACPAAGRSWWPAPRPAATA
jgi:putative spermidine/putrescine transport system permease protein